VGGFAVNLESKDITLKFGPLQDPHDIAVTNDAREVGFIVFLFIELD
jgi:hypothetical protein